MVDPAHRERQHGRRGAQGALPTRCRSAHAFADRLRRRWSGACLGPGPRLGIDRVLVPKASPAFSALGLLVSDYWSTSCGPTWSSSPTSTSPGCASWRPNCGPRPRRTGAGPSWAKARCRRDLFAQMCYHGQNFDMSVPAARRRVTFRGRTCSTWPTASTTSTRQPRGFAVPDPAAVGARRAARAPGSHAQAAGAGPDG